MVLAAIEDLRAPRRIVEESWLKVIVIEDPSDTWSHDVVGYGETPAGCFIPVDIQVEEKGPLRASLRIDARFNMSSLSLWTRLYDNDPRIELELLIHWHERLRVAKLVLPVGGTVLHRHDGIPGGAAERAQDGRESPVVDWTVARLSDGGTMAVACPDCFGLDGIGDVIRFTLLRSPAYAWHQPARLPQDHAHRFMDQGEHLFRFTLLPGGDSRAANAHAHAIHRPPICIDWTRGM
jgi:alpha-mannosidase